jgi:predicted patatin/cPLA2 family phospholipase
VQLFVILWRLVILRFESLKINRIEEILNQGMYNYNIIQKHCEKLTLEKIGYLPTLSDMKQKYNKELVVCTYNFTESKKEYISYKNYPNMLCLDALRMSSNLPFIFNEYVYEGKEYIDGAFADNLPISYIDLEKPEKRVAILLKDKEKDEIVEEKDSIYGNLSKVLDRFYKLMFIPVLENRKKIIETYEKHVDMIHIDVENVKIYKFNLSHSEKLELFSLGYNKAKEYFKSNL